MHGFENEKTRISWFDLDVRTVDEREQATLIYRQEIDGTVTSTSITLTKLSLMADGHIAAFKEMVGKPHTPFKDGADYEGLGVRLTIACREACIPCPIEKHPDGGYVFNPAATKIPRSLRRPDKKYMAG